MVQEEDFLSIFFYFFTATKNTRKKNPPTKNLNTSDANFFPFLEPILYFGRLIRYLTISQGL